MACAATRPASALAAASAAAASALTAFCRTIRRFMRDWRFRSARGRTSPATMASSETLPVPTTCTADMLDISTEASCTSAGALEW